MQSLLCSLLLFNFFSESVCMATAKVWATISSRMVAAAPIHFKSNWGWILSSWWAWRPRLVNMQSTHTAPCRVSRLCILHMKEFAAANFLTALSSRGTYSPNGVSPASKSFANGHAGADRLSYCFVFIVVHRDATFLNYMCGLFLCEIMNTHIILN